MHPLAIYTQLMQDRARELQRVGAASRRSRSGSSETASPEEVVIIRRSTSDDGPALAALAALDAAPLPLGPALIAEVAGSPRAVLPLDGGPSFGDPFRHTGELVALLELRAAQIRREEEPTRHGRLAWMAPAALRRRLV